MADDKTIGNLTDGGFAQTGDEIPVERSGANFRVRVSYAVDTIEDLTALNIPADGQQVHVRGYNTADDGGGGVFIYDGASTAELDGVLAFAPDAARNTFFATDGFDTSSLRGDEGAPLRGNWTVSTAYLAGEFVRNAAGSFPAYWARADHTSTAADEPGVGANWEDFWALPDDPYVASLVPNDHNSPLQHQNIVFGSFFFEYLNGASQLFDTELHGHTAQFRSNSDPVFYTVPNSTSYKPYKLIWHKEGLLRDNAAFGLYGGLALFLQEHDTVGELLTYGYDYVTSAGRWLRQMSGDAALTPAMIGCVPDDHTVDNYDLLAWLINVAEDVKRKISLSGVTWYSNGHIVLSDGIVIEGYGRNNSGIRVPPETTRSSIWWADIYHMFHEIDPADYDQNIDTALAILAEAGRYRVTAELNVGGTVNVAHFFDSTDANWTDVQDVVDYIAANTLPTVNIPGTVDQGGGVFVEPAGTVKVNEPRMFLENAEYAMSQAGDAISIDLRGFEVDGNASNNTSWLTTPDYSYFWLGGTSSPLSGIFRESSRGCGLNISIERVRPLQTELKVTLRDMWIHDQLGSCLLSARSDKHFDGINVKLGNSLGGRVKYGGSGTWVNLELHGRSRTSVHRGYVENITGHKYRSEGETLPIWEGNDSQQNILATGVNRIKDSTFPYPNQQFFSTGIDFDLRGSLFDSGIALSGNNVVLQGGINGADVPLALSGSSTQGLLYDHDLDLRFENIPVPATGTSAGLDFTSVTAFANGRIKLTFLETYTDDGGGNATPSFPLPELPVPEQIIRSPIVVLQSKASLATEIEVENVRDHADSIWMVRAEHYVGNVVEVGNPPGTASDAIPTTIRIVDAAFKNIHNWVVGWGTTQGQVPANGVDYNLRIIMENVGFRLFDPGDTGGAIGDNSRRAFVGDEAVVDDWLKIVRMTGCYTTNAGGEMINIGGGKRQWDSVTFDPLDLSPKLWSEADVTISFTATGSELTDAGDGTFYYELQPGLMWKPASVSVQARSLRTSELSIPNYATIHRDPTTDSPINPLLRVYFTSQFTASDVVEFRVTARVTS